MHGWYMVVENRRVEVGIFPRLAISVRGEVSVTGKVFCARFAR